MTDLRVNGTFRAPMRNEGYKRFAAYKKAPKRSWIDFLFDWIIKGIIIALLISINYVLYASSANYSLFAEGASVIPTIVFPIVVIFTISLFTMFFISFSRLMENLLVSFVVGVVVFATINQFMIISPDSFLYSIFYNKISPEFAQNFVSNSDVVTAVFFAVLSFVLLSTLSNKSIFIGAVVVLIAFVAIIADEYINQRTKEEFITLYESENEKKGLVGNKFIYIMLPNATSYKYLTDMEKEQMAVGDIQKTKDIMLGFFARNNFILYDNAYVEDTNQYYNIVNQFNILSNKKVEDSLLDQIAIDGYMKFKNYNEKSVYLEQNKLFSKFKNANYRINVYQSQGIELCQSNNEKIADKCVEKLNHPFNFRNMHVSNIEKTKFLLLQWINSTTLFKDLSITYAVMSVFTDANKLGLVGIPYNNLNVINSINTLDIMFSDIINETSNTTYFALLDIPSDMYVYDEYCNIKPSSEWLSKDNLPWVKNPNLSQRKKAYMDQTNCLYGKLQEFIDKLNAYDLNKNTVIVIQGISGLNDKAGSDKFIIDFRNKKSVVMAIREPKIEKFTMDYKICPVSSILIKYLYGKEVCKPLEDFDLDQQSKFLFYNDATQNPVTKKDLSKARNTYEKWYREWKNNTKSGIDKIFADKEKKKQEEIEALRKLNELPVLEIMVEDGDFELQNFDENAIQKIDEIGIPEDKIEEKAKELDVSKKQVEPKKDLKPEPVIDVNENFYLDEDLYNDDGEIDSDKESNKKIKEIKVDDNELLSIDLKDLI